MKLYGYFSGYTGIPNNIYMNIFMVLVQSIAIGVCYFLSLYFVNVLGVSVELSGMMFSCYGLGTILGGIFGGKLADKWSTNYISIACLTIQAICFLLPAKIHNSIFIMLNLFLLGLSFYIFRTSSDVTMLALCLNGKNNRQKVVNISRVAMNLGLGISGVIIGSLAVYGFENIFYIFSLILVASAIFLSRSHRANSFNDVGHNSESQNITYATNKSLLLLALICLFCVGLMIAQLGATYPLYVIYLFPEMGMKAVSVLYLLDTFLIVCTQAQIGHALRNANKVFVMASGALFMGLGMAMLTVSYVFSVAILACIIWTVGEMLFMPFAQLVCYENGGAKKRGQALGFYQSVYATSAVIGPTAGGYIYQQDPQLLWWLCGLLGAFCLIICLSVPQVHAYTATQEG